MISEADKYKAAQQLKMALGGDVLQVFNKHGLGDFIPYVADIIVDLAILYRKRCSGEDIPITAELARARNEARRHLKAKEKLG